MAHPSGLSYPQQLTSALNKFIRENGRTEVSAEATVYYQRAFSHVACASFERFKGSWAYEQWKKKEEVKQAIEAVKKEWRGYPHFANI
jgi:hypothetical protein